MTWQFLLTIALGFATGVISGAFGIGGATISTPGIRVLGATPLEGVGSTMPCILPSAITSMIRYHKAGLIRVPVVAWTASAGAVFAIGGALLSREVPGNGHLLMIATAALLFLNACNMARTPRANLAEGETTRSPKPTPALPLLIIGVLAGTLSGILGIGGGVLMVPLFVRWIRLTVKEAVAASIACVGIIAVPGIVTHQLLGNINWTYALGLMIAIVPGAWLGASLAVRAQEQHLRIAVAGVLGLIAIGYAIGEIASWLH
ncbi:MAG: sulfite exporter TauE/SafE family protein [Acidimicrobiia bacterium]